VSDLSHIISNVKKKGNYTNYEIRQLFSPLSCHHPRGGTPPPRTISPSDPLAPLLRDGFLAMFNKNTRFDLLLQRFYTDERTILTRRKATPRRSSRAPAAASRT
jgi:hypothetical protein